MNGFVLSGALAVSAALRDVVGACKCVRQQEDDWLRSLAMLRFIAFVTVLAIVGWGSWVAYNRFTPPQDNPFKPLDLSLPPGLTTGMKLRGLADDPAFCRSLLSEVGVEYTEVDRQIDNPNCSLDGALTLDRSLAPYSETLTMTCPLVAALYVWERHVLIPAAEEIMEAELARIDTVGAYSCRRVNSAATGRWSQHATANALDITGFRFENGERVTVLGDFGDDTPAGRFLERVRQGSCDLFATTLGPDYNDLHRDHFHLDMGRFSICS